MVAMVIDEMAENECRDVLVRATIGRLGCSLDNQPYVVPVYLACEPGHVYVFSTIGKKIEWMRANPKVCVQIDEIMSPSQWVSVLANGRYQELLGAQYEAEHAHARELLGKRHEWWLNALAERRRTSDDLSVESLFFRIDIDSMTGLCARSEIGGDVL
jgi:nitroimidazol reductase NimA-like FMN-containing flavoprotein (pyridoxamine 5'-phosphate oxidase superfamily)